MPHRACGTAIIWQHCGTFQDLRLCCRFQSVPVAAAPVGPLGYFKELSLAARLQVSSLSPLVSQPVRRPSSGLQAFGHRSISVAKASASSLRVQTRNVNCLVRLEALAMCRRIQIPQIQGSHATANISFLGICDVSGKCALAFCRRIRPA